jgi:hypothetical protein
VALVTFLCRCCGRPVHYGDRYSLRVVGQRIAANMTGSPALESCGACIVPLRQGLVSLAAGLVVAECHHHAVRLFADAFGAVEVTR